MKKKILVVGGAGFIGSHVTKFLERNGYQTVIFDNLSTGDARSIIQGEFVKGDLASKSDLQALFETYSFEAVLHLAAHIEVGESVKDPLKYYRNNVANSLNLFETMIRYHVKNLIFSSTAAVYGDPIFTPMTEEHPCLPINPYGRTKLMIESILQDLHKGYEFNYIALRYFNAAGGDSELIIKNYQTAQANIIPRIFKSLADQTPLTVYGSDYPTRDGTCIRDYIHLEDLASAHVKAMELLIKEGRSKSYNLGNGIGYSVKEVIQTTEQITQQKIHFVYGARRAGDPPVLIADSRLAQQELDWTPRYTNLSLIIEHAWQALPQKAEAVEIDGNLNLNLISLT